MPWPARQTGLKGTRQKKSAGTHSATRGQGGYVLPSNILHWSATDLWPLYRQLTHAESAFRIHKSDLLVRPLGHQKEKRVQAHILVCFLAYGLWKTLERWQSQAGLGHSPRTLLEELRRLQSTDVVLPTTDGPEVRLRRLVRPDKAQQDLLARLGLELPKRLRPQRLVSKM